jgi:hypothetical protein
MYLILFLYIFNAACMCQRFDVTKNLKILQNSLELNGALNGSRARRLGQVHAPYVLQLHIRRILRGCRVAWPCAHVLSADYTSV